MRSNDLNPAQKAIASSCFFVARSNAGFLWLVGAGDQTGVYTGEQVDDEAIHTAVTRVVDLADILELVVDRFNQRPLSQHQPASLSHNAGHNNTIRGFMFFRIVVTSCRPRLKSSSNNA